VVFEIGVLDEDGRATGFVEAAAESEAFTTIGGRTEEGDVFEAFEFGEGGVSTVGGAVVDNDKVEFEAVVEAAWREFDGSQVGTDLVYHQGCGFFFVIYGNYHRKSEFGLASLVHQEIGGRIESAIWLIYGRDNKNRLMIQVVDCV